MKRSGILFLVFLFPLAVLAQNTSTVSPEKDSREPGSSSDSLWEETSGKPFSFVESMPEFPGGHSALYAYLNRNLRYPVNAQEEGIQGRVILQFIIDEQGNIQDAKVIKSVHPSLDREALRVVNAMPKWVPGKQEGKPVKVMYNLPVSFKLQ